MFIGRKPHNLFPIQNKASADFFRRQQQKRIHALGPYLEQRSFRRNEGTTDYATIPEVTLASHFVIEFDLLVTSFAGGVKVMDGGTDGGSDRLDVNITALGVFDVRDYFKSYVNGVAGATVVLNQINKIRIVRDATDTNQTTRFLDILLARVNNTGNNLPGILANLKIYDNGTLVRDYPLDDNGDILANGAANLGEELVVNGNLSTTGIGNCSPLSGAVLVNTDSQLVITSSGGLFSVGAWENLGNAGETLLIEADIISTTGTVRGLDISNNVNYTITAGERFSQVVTLGSSSAAFGFGGNNDSSFEVVIDNISIRQADGYGSVINGNDSDWGLFRQQASGEWLGEELVVNGGFDTGLNGWTVDNTGGQTVEEVGGRLHIVTDGTGAGVSQNMLGLNLTYRTSLDYEAVTGGLKTQTSGTIVINNTTQNYTNDMTSTVDGSFFLYRWSGAGEGYFDNVSVKEVLNVA